MNRKNADPHSSVVTGPSPYGIRQITKVDKATTPCSGKPTGHSDEGEYKGRAALHGRPKRKTLPGATTRQGQKEVGIKKLVLDSI